MSIRYGFSRSKKWKEWQYDSHPKFHEKINKHQISISPYLLDESANLQINFLSF